MYRHLPIRHILLLAALSASLALPSTARSFALAGPCVAGSVYDAACDVDHDGDVDIFDIQKTAGHWNQSGVWTSDNDHNHLGQTWTGSNNPLRIEGSFGSPDFAPLVLSSPGGVGLRISSAVLGVVVDSADLDGMRVYLAGDDGIHVNSAGDDGVDVGYAGNDGMHVSSAGDDGVDVSYASNDGVDVVDAGDSGVNVTSAGVDGVRVRTAGTPSAYTTSPRNNGFEVAGAQGNGLWVGRADVIGVEINSVGLDAFYAANVGRHGLNVRGAAEHGVRVAAAGIDGVNVTGSQYAGNFAGNINVTGNCIGCLQANFAVNVGDRPLQPGDVVSVLAVTSTDFDTGRALWQVAQAQPGQAVVGVVAGRAELVVREERRPTETGQRLVPREGPAQPGEYVTIVYSGPMQVRAAPGEGAVAAGTRLTAALDGTVRPLQTRTIEGMLISEGAPVVGVALQASDKDGQIWVLVSPQ